VVTSSGRHEADVVILAAGLGVPGLAQGLGSRGSVPLIDKPGTLTILTQPMPRFLDHILVTGALPSAQRTGSPTPVNTDDILPPFLEPGLPRETFPIGLPRGSVRRAELN
jgi:glycine/D-amino acid oxidase-like deaminating enzyme